MCGWLKDRFGLSWQIVPDAPLRAASRTPTRPAPTAATEAMLRMRKIVVAELEAAADAAAARSGDQRHGPLPARTSLA